MKKTRRSRTLWSSTRGQSLVEFAMVLPLLLVVAFIITEFGRALWIKNALTEAAGAAGRAAIVSNTDDFEDDARAAADSILMPMGMGTASPDASTFEAVYDPTSDMINVTISRSFSFIPSGPLPTTPGAGKDPFIELTTITISSRSSMHPQPNF